MRVEPQSQSELRWVRVSLPPAFQVGVRGLAEMCGWSMRERSGVFEICLSENHLSQEPELLSVEELARSGEPVQRATLEWLMALPNPRDFLTLPMDLVNAEINRLNDMDTIGAKVALFQLLTTVSAPANLPDLMTNLYNDVLRAFDDQSSLHMIRLYPRLSRRYAAARATLAAAVSPEALQGPPENFVGFKSARGVLNASTIGAWPYLAPALVSLAPFVTGILASCGQADLVWLFGQPLVGRVHPTDQLLPALALRGGRFTSPDQLTGEARPSATGADAVAYLAWWVKQVNTLLSIATDPTLFADPSGSYDPRRHTAFLLSFERLFRDVLDILVGADGPEGNLLRATYDALDCIEGMLLGLLPGDRVASFRHLTTPSHARATLDLLESVIPADVARVALPKCRAAVDGLDTVKAGFFLQRHVSTNGLIDIPGHTGTRKWDDAIPDYLRIDRNAAHSFLTEIDPDRNPGNLEIFMSHEGTLASDLLDIPFLWLMLLVAQPHRLSTPLLRRAARPARTG